MAFEIDIDFDKLMAESPRRLRRKTSPQREPVEESEQVQKSRSRRLKKFLERKRKRRQIPQRFR